MIKNDNIKKEKRVNPQKKLCPDCDKSFMKSYIKTHMVKMHGVSCNICDSKFKTENYMMTHRELSHSQAAIHIVKDVLNSKWEAKKR